MHNSSGWNKSKGNKSTDAANNQGVYQDGNYQIMTRNAGPIINTFTEAAHKVLPINSNRHGSTLDENNCDLDLDFDIFKT